MAYTINKTDGTILATVADGQIDTISSDLTLIGKNYSGFGESINENFIKLLENFSSTAAPDNPIRGQIWFDVNELKLKVYNGNAFVPVSSATISNTQPTSLGVGDLWFNDVDKQLYLFQEIVNHGLSVRKVEELVRQLQIIGKGRKPAKASGISFQYMKIQDDLASKFSTNVKLKLNENGKGSIEIGFMSDDDLNRILEMLDW